MMERWKAEIMTAKKRKAGGEISLSSKEEDESDIRDDTDPNQANPNQTDDKYPLEL